jgi:hypothetical protein
MTEVTPLLHDAPGEKYVTPLPRLPMAILALAIFSEPVSSTILLPFIYFMVRLGVFIIPIMDYSLLI